MSEARSEDPALDAAWDRAVEIVHELFHTDQEDPEILDHLPYQLWAQLTHMLFDQGWPPEELSKWLHTYAAQDSSEGNA